MSLTNFEDSIHVGGVYQKERDGRVTVVEIDRDANPPKARVIEFKNQARRGRRSTEIVQNEVVLLDKLGPA